MKSVEGRPQITEWQQLFPSRRQNSLLSRIKGLLQPILSLVPKLGLKSLSNSTVVNKPKVVKKPKVIAMPDSISSEEFSDCNQEVENPSSDCLSSTPSSSQKTLSKKDLLKEKRNRKVISWSRYPADSLNRSQTESIQPQIRTQSRLIKGRKRIFNRDIKVIENQSSEQQSSGNELPRENQMVSEPQDKPSVGMIIVDVDELLTAPIKKIKTEKAFDQTENELKYLKIKQEEISNRRSRLSKDTELQSYQKFIAREFNHKVNTEKMLKFQQIMPILRKDPVRRKTLQIGLPEDKNKYNADRILSELAFEEKRKKEEMERVRLELERQRQLELERQRQLELEKQRQADIQKQKALKLDQEKQAEQKKQRQQQESKKKLEEGQGQPQSGQKEQLVSPSSNVDVLSNKADLSLLEPKNDDQNQKEGSKAQESKYNEKESQSGSCSPIANREKNPQESTPPPKVDQSPDFENPFMNPPKTKVNLLQEIISQKGSTSPIFQINSAPKTDIAPKSEVATPERKDIPLTNNFRQGDMCAEFGNPSMGIFNPTPQNTMPISNQGFFNSPNMKTTFNKVSPEVRKQVMEHIPSFMSNIPVIPNSFSGNSPHVNMFMKQSPSEPSQSTLFGNPGSSEPSRGRNDKSKRRKEERIS